MVAAECGEMVERVDTASDAGQAELREVSPIRKVPVAIVDGRTLFDSRVIIDWLTTTRGWGGLAPPRDQFREHNIINAIDAALLSVIQVFYLKRAGIDPKAFGDLEIERADAIFAWLAGQLAEDGHSFGAGFGLAEVSLVCALDWMDFRQTYPTGRAAALAEVRVKWGEQASLVVSRPHA